MKHNDIPKLIQKLDFRLHQSLWIVLKKLGHIF